MGENMQKIKLGNIASLITKGTTPTSIGYDFTDSGINFIKIESISDEGEFIESKFAHISEECNNKLKRSQLVANDILFSIAGAIGRVAKVTENILPANTNQALALIRIKPGIIDYDFLCYILQSRAITEQFEKKKQGVAQLNISLADIGNFEIPLIAYTQQLDIVKKLDRITDIINTRNKQLEKLDELIKSKFTEIFGNYINTQYPIIQIADICEFIKDGTHQTPTYTEDSSNGYKFLSSKDVTSGYIDWSKIKYIPAELHNELYAKVAPQKGDILLAKNGTTGVCAIVDTDEVFDIYVSLALLRLKKDCNIKYIWSAINMPSTKEQFNASLKGIGVPNLHLGEIKKTKIVFPPLDLQNQFAKFVENVEGVKIKVKQNLDQLEVLKKSLMQKYFG